VLNNRKNTEIGFATLIILSFSCRINENPKGAATDFPKDTGDQEENPLPDDTDSNEETGSVDTGYDDASSIGEEDTGEISQNLYDSSRSIQDSSQWNSNFRSLGI